MTTKGYRAGLSDRKFAIMQEKVRTEHIWINPKKCTACWNCVGDCPKQVIGKAGFLWHKHIIIKNADNCTGCKKCIRSCPHGVFSEEMPEALRNRFEKRGFNYSFNKR